MSQSQFPPSELPPLGSIDAAAAGRPAPAAKGPRPLGEAPEQADRAAKLMRTPSALHEMSELEARCVAGYMGLVNFALGATLFREGDNSNTGYLLLVLSGEVAVQTPDQDKGASVDISVLGAGSIIGEMGLLDGAPRSATCIALSPIQAAVLSRVSLSQLIDEHPKVGAKLMVALSKRLADRLRAMGEQLQMYSHLAGTLQMQLDMLRSSDTISR